MNSSALKIREFAQPQAYYSVWEAMQTFTRDRTNTTVDELWLLEHEPVFTLGQAGKEEHILQRGNIPILKVDRGGQVTYHGPGQLMAYTLLDLRRKSLSVHQLVHSLENTLIALLKAFHIAAYADPNAPGVYVEGKKIGSIGLRVRHGCAYHGLSFNVHADLHPFQMINPCGYKNLQMINLSDLTKPMRVNDLIPLFITHFCRELGYNSCLD